MGAVGNSQNSTTSKINYFAELNYSRPWDSNKMEMIMFDDGKAVVTNVGAAKIPSYNLTHDGVPSGYAGGYVFGWRTKKTKAEFVNEMIEKGYDKFRQFNVPSGMSLGGRSLPDTYIAYGKLTDAEKKRYGIER